MVTAEDFPELHKAMTAFSKDVVKRSRISLGVRRRKESVRAKWKDGRPYDIQRKNFLAVTNNTKRLSQSLKYEVLPSEQALSTTFSMEDYGKWVNEGRKPHSRWPPREAIKTWLRQRNIQARTAEGKFGKMSRAQLAFLIQRKIGWFGIKPTWFFTNSYNRAYAKHENLMRDALRKDVQRMLEGDDD